MSNLIQIWKAIAVIISAFLIAYGWYFNYAFFSETGAIIFILTEAFGLIEIYKYSILVKLNKNKAIIEKEFKPVKDNIVYRIIGGSIVLAGLLAFIDGLALGYIIWIGEIAIYFLSGAIINFITDYKLKMGYGGWYLPKTKK